jgi:hypothetical protein
VVAALGLPPVEVGFEVVAGGSVVAIGEELGRTVEVTVRDAAGLRHVLAFVEPLAFKVLSLLDVVLSAAVVAHDDPWIGRVCAALGEDPAGYRCFTLLDGAGLARFRIVARGASWR